MTSRSMRRKRIYASCGDGAIAVVRQLDTDRYESLATIPTSKKARTSVLNTADGSLYLAVPRLADRPEQKGTRNLGLSGPPMSQSSTPMSVQQTESGGK